MALRVRVDPWGELHAATGRTGDLLGLDAALHRDRLADGVQPRHGVRGGRRLGERWDEPEPEGVMVVDGAGDVWVAVGGRWRRWGFGSLADGSPTGGLRLLTPPSAVAALRAGYRPSDHPLVA